MILFIFEGSRREPELYKTMEYLFFKKKKDTVICSFCSNIYVLYQKMQASDFMENIVTVLQHELNGRPDNPLKAITNREVFSEVFLFFDYDCHNQDKEGTISFAMTNAHLTEMLSFFTDETENGKLYINYPMVESIRYTKQLPDADFNSYTVSVSSSANFKQLTDTFSYYGNLDFVAFRVNKKGDLKTPDQTKIDAVKANWDILLQQHASKANFICTDKIGLPDKKSDIEQKSLFKAQLAKYIQPEQEIAILNAFPIFLYEYLK
jgi:hypothetical protein